VNLEIQADPVPLHVDDTGTIRIGQSRVTLDVLLTFHRQGMSPETLAENFPSLSLADVYGTLAYYFRHQQEMDEYLRQRDQQAEASGQPSQVSGVVHEDGACAPFPPVGTDAWGQMNRKRAELIRKKIQGGLSAAEQEQYETLQRRSLEALERASPRSSGDHASANRAEARSQEEAHNG
jgi:uncharacterized protein (DUF433 family)